MGYRKRGYRKRICYVCGKEFIPHCGAQRMCSPECTQERKNLKRRKWQMEHLEDYYRMHMKPPIEDDMAPHVWKTEDTIVAIGYAERQRAQTLSTIPPIKTTL